MKKEDIINKVRFYLHDTEKLLWRDEELESMLFEAVRQYSADTAIFCGVFDIVPTIAGEFKFPKDYIHFLVGWNKFGDTIQACSVKNIWDFNRQGEIEFIYDDASSNGSFNVYPEKNINVIYDTFSGDYGVYSFDYGVFEKPFDNGLVYSITAYEFSGDIIYCRIADIEEVQDYTALVYKVLELAHSTESEFADINMAKLFRNSYNSRVARFKYNKHKTTGYYSTGIFY